MDELDVDQGKGRAKKVKVGIVASLSTFAAIAVGVEPEVAMKLVGEAAASQIAQAGFFFTLAAMLHARQVRKEIANQFGILTGAINNVATALKKDLESHAERLDKVEDGFQRMDSRVTKLEHSK